MFVWIILTSFWKIFTWRGLMNLILLLLIYDSFFDFIGLLNGFHLSFMSLKFSLYIFQCHIIKWRLYMNNSLLSIFLFSQIIIFMQIHIIILHNLIKLLPSVIFHIVNYWALLYIKVIWILSLRIILTIFWFTLRKRLFAYTVVN